MEGSVYASRLITQFFVRAHMKSNFLFNNNYPFFTEEEAYLMGKEDYCLNKMIFRVAGCQELLNHLYWSD